MVTTTAGELQPTPILIQLIGDQFFHQMTWYQFPLAGVQVVPTQQQALTYEERNTLHYTAGAIYSTLKKKEAS